MSDGREAGGTGARRAAPGGRQQGTATPPGAAQQSRPQLPRRAAAGALAGAGVGLLAGCGTQGGPAGPAGRVGPEPPPETTRLRLGWTGSTCQAPHYLAAEFLPAEGFTDVSYTQIAGGPSLTKAVVSGEVDMAMLFSGPLIVQVDAGDRFVMLAGVHPGCFELFGTERVRAIRDLKGKTVPVPALGGAPHVFLSSMAAHVGLDPRKDITWLVQPPAEAIRLLAGGQVDAYLALPPDAQELRARKIGHVVVNSTTDRPWAQYFCCMVYANPEFVQRHPVATKRALRTILKAGDLCAREPEQATRYLVDKGYSGNYEYALESMREIPYGKWRAYDPEDTVRYYALRLREAGMIRSSPQKIIAQATDWRFLKELKQELRG